MIRSFLRTLAVSAMLAAGLVQTPGVAAPNPAAAPLEDPNGARVIVRYKALGGLMRGLRAANGPVRGPQLAAAMTGRHGLSLRDGRIVEGRSQVLHGDRSMSSAELAARLAADSEVEFAVPDYRRVVLATPNDPLYAASASISPAAGQWYLRAPDATFVSAINAPAAWAITTGSASVVVADVDTGVRFDHPDLANKLYPGYDFVSGLSNAGDSNGWDADASDPGDWNTAGECGFGTAASNSSWHGTQTAGLIGAQTDNAIGMASIGHDVMVLPVRALGKCGGFDSDILAAMMWAAGLSTNPTVNPHPARVINLSLGGSGTCIGTGYQPYINQLVAAGVVVVAAAGNSEGLAVSTPGNCTGVITVTGVRHVGTKVGFSSVGPEVAIAAPAGNCVNTTGPCLYPILTTINAGTTTPSTNTYSTSSNYSVGTSFATPLVAGTAALMLSANPALTPTQVKSLMQSSARTFPTTSSDPSVAQCHAPNGFVQDECLCTTSTCGAGMLDAGAAVAAAAAVAVPVVRIAASAATVLAGSSVGFDGSASVMPAGRSVASYQWTITSGATLAAISGTATASTATVATTNLGSFTVRLNVTDSSGASASATSTVTVTAPGRPVPQVLASADVVGAGASVTFDGSGSTVASGLGVKSYAWSLVSGAALAHFTSATTGATATVATDGAGSGSFTVRLTVTDSIGQSSSRDLAVAVTAVVPTAVISASASTVTVGNSVTLDGSGSSATAGRTIAACQWSISSGAAFAGFSGATTNCAAASVAATAAGSFTVTLQVTDSAGAQAAQSVTITANAVVATGGGSSGGGQASGGTTTGSTAASGGGAGAMSGAWVMALLLAAGANAVGRRRRA